MTLPRCFVHCNKRCSYTLSVAPDASSKASGSLYIDDGATNSHLTGMWQRAEFSWSSSASGGILAFTAGKGLQCRHFKPFLRLRFMLGAGATDAKGRIGQLKGTGLVLERVYVPLASKPSRVALQQHGGTGERNLQFVLKSGVVEVSCVEYVTESWLCDLIAAAELPPPSLAGVQHLRSRGTLLHPHVLFVKKLRGCRQPLSCATSRYFGIRTFLSTLPNSKFIVLLFVRANPLPHE